MNDVIRSVAASVVLVAACWGCRARSIDAVSSLPHEAITYAQRADWRRLLMWSDDCEDAFRASHAGESGGINVVQLGSARSLVEVTCAAGSYQPSVIRFALTDDAAGARYAPLSFPVYSSDDGRRLLRSEETEVWGESAVTSTAAEIAVLTVARQTADCGVWARYSLSGDRPRLLAAAARVQCPDTPETPVSVSPAGPPAGWEPIPRED